MTPAPLVTIVVAVYNDEPSIGAALTSALNQTLEQVEVLVIDDGSTDDTPSIVEEFARRDPRVKLLRQPENMSAFQARRRGIFEARAGYVMFLDGDDELDRHAAAKAVAAAQSSQADMVQFGIKLFWSNANRTSGAFEKRLQPQQLELWGDEIATGLFPAGRPVGGQLWKYLFETELLRDAYLKLPADQQIFRANDLPITYLAAIAAKHYVSIPEKLYRYHFQRGGSGNLIETIDEVEFHMLPLDSLDLIAERVQEGAYTHSDPQALLDSFDSARLAMISTVVRYLNRVDRDDLVRESIARLERRTSRIDVVRAVTRFQPAFLSKLAQFSPPDTLGARPVRSVLLTTSALTTGGVSGVLLAQATVLLSAGYEVTIAVQRAGQSDLSLVPEGAAFCEVEGKDLSRKLENWGEICHSRRVDLIIEHRVLYSRNWPAFALMARACEAPTIGWIHNFAGRPIYDLNDMHSFLVKNLPILAQLVVLSPLDVAFWKLRSITNTAFLPNPPSPLLQQLGVSTSPKSPPSGQIELVWVGRLDERTKQVRALLDVAQELDVLDASFFLTVIGPDWPGLTAEQFNAEADKRGISHRVQAVGPRTGLELVEALDRADAFVSTSVIEGYQLTLVEAQARALPVFMYEMPWLLPVQDNEGIVAVEQGNARALAHRIVQTMADGNQYAALSQASLEAAERAMDSDFAMLYERLINGILPSEFSPEPSLEQAGKLLDLIIFFTERNAGVLKQLQTADISSKSASAETRAARTELTKLQAEVERLSSASPQIGTETTVRPKQISNKTPGAGYERNADGVKESVSTLRRQMGRVKRVASRLISPKVLQVTDARLAGDTLRLVLTLDRRKLPAALSAYRQVGEAITRHPFALQQRSDGTAMAVIAWSNLGDRRWSLRADYVDENGPSEVVVPLQMGLRCSSDGRYRIRTFAEGTFQVVIAQ